MKHKAIGIQEKPEVNLEKLENLKLEEEMKADEIEQKIEPKKEVVEEKPKVDWEIKFKESQKEALVLKSQLDKMAEEKVNKIEINEDYLSKKYPDWQDLSLGEQKAIKKAEELELQIQEIRNETNQFNNDRKWQEKVEVFVSDELSDAFPQLMGREEEFKRFATRPTRKGLPLDDLAKIFLFENPSSEPKRSLFHAPGGQPSNETQEPGLSADEIRVLRTTKPLEYMRLVQRGKIKIKI